MAVSIRLRATTTPIVGRGLYVRRGSRGAFNAIPASTSSGATGGVVSRQKVAVYGTVTVQIPDASRDDDIESRVRRNTNRTFWNPTWSVLRPQAIRLFDGLRYPPNLPHPVTFAIGTSVGPPGGVAPQPRGRVLRRTGAMDARVTTTPKPTFNFKTQGKKNRRGATPTPRGHQGTQPVHKPGMDPHVVMAPHSGSPLARKTTAASNPSRGPLSAPTGPPVRPVPVNKRRSRPLQAGHVNPPRAVR